MQASDEIPLLVMLFYLFRNVEARQVFADLPDSGVKLSLVRVIYAGDNVRWGVWLGRHIC